MEFIPWVVGFLIGCVVGYMFIGRPSNEPENRFRCKGKIENLSVKVSPYIGNDVFIKASGTLNGVDFSYMLESEPELRSVWSHFERAAEAQILRKLGMLELPKIEKRSLECS